MLGVFLAFPIARGYLKHSNLWYGFFLFQGFLPPAVIPLFLETRTLHLYNNMIGYVVVRSLYGAGFFFFVGYLRGIPKEREEAAALDGCGYIRFILTIILPEMAPALAAFGVFGFVAQWNELIIPIILLPNSNLYPVTRGLFGFFSTYTNQWPLLCAATLIVALPLVVVFIVFCNGSWSRVSPAAWWGLPPHSDDAGPLGAYRRNASRILGSQGQGRRVGPSTCRNDRWSTQRVAFSSTSKEREVMSTTTSRVIDGPVQIGSAAVSVTVTRSPVEIHFGQPGGSVLAQGGWTFIGGRGRSGPGGYLRHRWTCHR